MTNLDVHVVRGADIETRWVANLWRHLPCTEIERFVKASSCISDMDYRGHEEAGFIVNMVLGFPR